jgi:hypothetical protein
VLNATKQPETHYYLPPWLPYDQILCAEYRSSVLNNNSQHSEWVGVAKLSSSKTEPVSEPAKAFGTTAAEAAVVECKDDESNDKHISINALESVSAATAYEHPVIPEGDVTLALNQALADCKATTTTGESAVAMKPTSQPCNQHTRTGEAAFNIIRSAPAGSEEVLVWEYNPARWVIRLLIIYMFISNLMLVQQHIC